MICVSVSQRDYSRRKEIVLSSPMVEIRSDLCGCSTEELAEIVGLHPNVLITCRIENSGVDFAYEQITCAIDNGAKYVDIEIEAPASHMKRVEEYAKARGCKFIISYHNFKETNTLEELKSIYDNCLSMGADIVKIVTMAHNISDSVRTLSLYKMVEDRNSLIAFAMGEAGKVTRRLCLNFGSPFTYVAYDANSATASGQYTKDEIEKLLSKDNFPYIFQGLKPKTQEIEIPCSKSVAQRAILAAALSGGVTTLNNFAPCNDIDCALGVIEKLGAKIEHFGSTIKITGIQKKSLNSISSISVGESGLLTRLLIPFSVYLSMVTDREIEINGHGSILNRDLSESIAAIEKAGATCRSETGKYLPFNISGGFTSNNIEFSGKASSQIVSGFLMTLPLLEKNSVLTITNPTSVPYINLTLEVIERFGIKIDILENREEKIVYSIKGGQEYKPTETYLDADWSSASFFAVAGAIGDGITLKKIGHKSLQADIAVLEVLMQCGAGISYLEDGDIKIESAKLNSFNFDATNAPDLFPILALLASHCSGVSCIKGVNRLAQKESNRAESIYSEFSVLGTDIDIKDDEMFITGAALHGGEVLSHNDHRIAMSLIIASLFMKEKISLNEVRCIDKSFPQFIDFVEKLYKA